tara:strand:+ start:1039 stop:1248 length:210 start_codon:yes stop_codon:yes gene_type:complete
MNIAIVAIMFLVLWGWISYEIYYAPEYDENEMPVKKPSKRVKHRFHIDIKEDDINQDLGYMKDDKKDVE